MRSEAGVLLNATPHTWMLGQRTQTAYGVLWHIQREKWRRRMPERDVYHQVVIRALQKDGWEITHDPLTLRLGDARLYVDLGAEKLIEATKQGRYIAVEIKSFTGASFFAELHTALGQFLSYHTALALLASDRVLYLAVPLDTYETYFTSAFVQTILDKATINLMV